MCNGLKFYVYNTLKMKIKNLKKKQLTKQVKVPIKRVKIPNIS
ncbi:hypothetical protein SPHINGO8BC_110044 [Sphingobacterium multivorum]|uniref:Uncharacterized protein n=1 Tax=Sphingobacterium multivorum TaxID=28454 RepID=A0A653Y2V4_SPHMU|nr:hypothetical protein SPHINGO8BC_110044 [Sphingobacterium multivorum]